MTGQELLRLLAHPMRLLLWVVATLALVLGTVSSWGVFGALLGALAGGLIGTLVAKSRVRAPVIAGGAVVVVLGLTWLTHLLVTAAVPAAIVGPVAALSLSEWLWYAGMAFAVVGSARVASDRSPSGGVLEVGLLAGGVAAGLAAHRDGAVARPLWLSDWAWQWGLEPGRVILSLGALLTVLLAVVLLLQSRRRKSAFALVAVPLLAVIVVSLLNFGEPDGPPPAAEVADVRDELGDPPLPNDGSGDHGGPSQQNEGDDKGSDTSTAGGSGDQGTASGSIGGGEQGTDTTTAGGSEQGTDTSTGSGGGGDQGTDTSTGGGSGDQGSDTSSGSDSSSDLDSDTSSDTSSESKSSPPPKPPPPDAQPPPDQKPKPQPVAVVLLGDDYEPPLGYYYLRDSAQSRLEGGRLVDEVALPLDRDARFSYPIRSTELAAAPAADGRVLLHSQVAMLARHDRAFGLTSVQRVAPLQNPDPRRFAATYEVESLAIDTPLEELVRMGVGDPRWDDATREHYLQIPDDPRYNELATSIIDTLPPDVRDQPMARVVAIKQWLDANVKYSKRHKHAGTADPTADFLFGDRIGFCVHNAHAAAYLWRAVGVPSRVGTGYAVEVSRLRGSALVVMGSDAHAWPELYVDGRGWVILDIAPSEDLDPPEDPVDDDTVAALANLARMDAIEEPRPPRDWSWVGRAARYLALSTALILTFGALLGHWSVKLWRRWRVLFAGPKTAPRVVYRVALDLLAEVGLVRDEGETREDFATRCAAVAPAFVELTRLHLAAQMSDPSRTMQGRPERDPHVYKRLLRQLGGELEHRPWWRRVLGLLNPISFYGAR